MFSVENIKFDRWTRSRVKSELMIKFVEKLKRTEIEVRTHEERITQIWSGTNNQRRYYYPIPVLNLRILGIHFYYLGLLVFL